MRNGKPERGMWVCHNFFLENTWQLHRRRAAWERKRDHVMNEIVMEKDSRAELELVLAAMGLELGKCRRREFLWTEFEVLRPSTADCAEDAAACLLASRGKPLTIGPLNEACPEG